MSRAEYLAGPVEEHPDAVEFVVQSAPEQSLPPGSIEVLDDERVAPASADLEIEIPGAGMIRRANVTPFRAVLVVGDDRANGGGPRPVLIEVRNPEEMRSAARVLSLAAHEMETLRAARADVRNRERRYQPGRIAPGAHGGACP